MSRPAADPAVSGAILKWSLSGDNLERTVRATQLKARENSYEEADTLWLGVGNVLSYVALKSYKIDFPSMASVRVCLCTPIHTCYAMRAASPSLTKAQIPS